MPLRVNVGNLDDAYKKGAVAIQERIRAKVAPVTDREGVIWSASLVWGGHLGGGCKRSSGESRF